METNIHNVKEIKLSDLNEFEVNGRPFYTVTFFVKCRDGSTAEMTCFADTSADLEIQK